jgi:hypothetical protein
MLVTTLLTTWQSNELLKHRADWIQLRVRTASEGPPVNTCVHSYSLYISTKVIHSNDYLAATTTTYIGSMTQFKR